MSLVMMMMTTTMIVNNDHDDEADEHALQLAKIGLYRSV